MTVSDVLNSFEELPAADRRHVAAEILRRVGNEAAVPTDDPLGPTRDWLLAMAREAEDLAPDLPSDLAEHHDHYAHGTPRS